MPVQEPPADISELWQKLIRREGGRIVYLVMDGLGGLPDERRGGTELQVASTPNLDRLVRESSCGLLELVGPGITPGSGPGHLALFGYDPLRYSIGRGVLSALGIQFDLREGDVAARVNFATLDTDGRIIDRRAGRLSTELNRELCDRLRSGVRLDFPGQVFFETVSEHRAVLVLRGPGLYGDVLDTDPQRVGVLPREPRATSDAGRPTAELVRSLVAQVRELLAREERANMILLRGFEQHRPYPTIEQRFSLKGVCVADYPMYRGISQLLGLHVPAPPGGLEHSFKQLRQCYGDGCDFYFLHAKQIDSHGEDGDFDSKVKAIEAFDSLLPLVTELHPHVLVITSDHSTPAIMSGHSWHPVPVLLRSKYTRGHETVRFDEVSCRQGALGSRPALHLMGLALAHAGRLEKFGA